MHPRSLILIFAPFISALAPEAIAFGSIDPFRAEAITPPRAQLATMPESGFIPCRSLPSGAVFDVLDVVDLALCQNPGTHEAWANARVQAAQVGVAQSART